MQDQLADTPSWRDTVTTIEVAGWQPAHPARPSGPNLLRRIRQVVPPALVPLARRGLARLPAGVRQHLLRSMDPDMGAIERDYQAWNALYDRVDDDLRRDVMAQIARMVSPPLISVVMPVFNPQPDHLLAAIRSVRDQFYPWWELCIGDDASTDPAVAAILQDAAATDRRIKLVRRERNGHICAASNAALRLATGLFVALLDHDDVLPPHALHEVALRIIEQPNVDIIYSDEDHIDATGHRSYPYFKPDWNPALMLGQNLISHMGVYRRTLVERVGGFRGGFEGSQDHDLALRVVAETDAQRIAHIPKVLYHWRQGAAEQTFSQAAQERCVRSSRRAIGEFAMRSEPDAVVEPAPVVPLWTRLVHPVPAPAPLVSIIVSCASTTDGLFDKIDRLLQETDYPAIEVLLLAREPTLFGTTGRDGWIRVVARHSWLRAARGSLLLLLDAGLRPAGRCWLREMVSQALCAGVGAVGAKLLGLDGTVRHAGFVIGPSGVASPFAGRRRDEAGWFGYLQLTRDVTAVSGDCMLVRRQALVQVGGPDSHLPLSAFGDVDLCLQLARAGYRTVWTPHAELYGPEGGPRSSDASLLRRRWGQALDRDRYWSPNLTADLNLAFPPLPVEAGNQRDGTLPAGRELAPPLAISV